MALAERVAVIINPISGTGGRPGVARARAEQAAALLTARGVAPAVVFTERPGHARELAAAALARGVTLVLSWGGDGTMNEVASALAYRDAALGIIPSGSGNGLARDLGIPLQPAAAFAVAFDGADFVMDAGEFDGRMFFNVAGVGLDARVAHAFAAGGLIQRGLRRYLAITTRELFTYRADAHTIVADGEVQHVRPLLIALANARQYGNGAIIAPGARLDDGRLDLVVVAQRSPLRALLQVPRVFLGQAARVPGVTMRTAVEVEIRSARPLLYHVDGEPYVGGTVVRAKTQPRALKIRVPLRNVYVARGPG